jgi:hypothetical protein
VNESSTEETEQGLKNVKPQVSTSCLNPASGNSLNFLKGYGDKKK